MNVSPGRFTIAKILLLKLANEVCVQDLLHLERGIIHHLFGFSLGGGERGQRTCQQTNGTNTTVARGAYGEMFFVFVEVVERVWLIGYADPEHFVHIDIQRAHRTNQHYVPQIEFAAMIQSRP